MIVRLRDTMKRSWVPLRVIEQIAERDDGCAMYITDTDGFACIRVTDNFDSLMMQIDVEDKHET